MPPVAVSRNIETWKASAARGCDTKNGTLNEQMSIAIRILFLQLLLIVIMLIKKFYHIHELPFLLHRTALKVSNMHSGIKSTKGPRALYGVVFSKSGTSIRITSSVPQAV